MTKTTEGKLKTFYQKLFAYFGPQHWWPGDTPFEIIVGAILTQNTNWGNVEKAICNLKKAKVLTPQALHKLSIKKLSTLIKPSGFFNIKAKRLKNFMDFLFEEYNGKISNMKKEPLPVLRKKFLSVNGIGPETADSILLYALNKPIFVVDAYTKRVLSRHGILDRNSDYREVQKIFMENLKRDVKLFNEYHALLVRVGKTFCKSKPVCENCPLKA